MATAQKSQIAALTLPRRIFTDKQLREKAGKWAEQIKRAGNGGRLKTDTIPATLEEAVALVRSLFAPGDAEIFIPALTEAFG